MGQDLVLSAASFGYGDIQGSVALWECGSVDSQPDGPIHGFSGHDQARRPRHSRPLSLVLPVGDREIRMGSPTERAPSPPDPQGLNGQPQLVMMINTIPDIFQSSVPPIPSPRILSAGARPRRVKLWYDYMGKSLRHRIDFGTMGLISKWSMYPCVVHGMPVEFPKNAPSVLDAGESDCSP